MYLKQVPVPSEIYRMMSQEGSRRIQAFISLDDLKCLVSLDPHPDYGELDHMSISRPDRYPTWDEIRDARYELLPADKDFMMVLPRKGDYVNFHQNCFHLWEIPKGWNIR